MEIGAGLAKAAMAGEVDGELVDLRTEVPEGAEVAILTFEDDYGQKAFHHSSSHLLAQAVLRLFRMRSWRLGRRLRMVFIMI